MAKQETELQELIINYLPYEEYKAVKEAGEINPNELYCTPDNEVNPPSMISDEFDPNKTYAVGDYCIAYNKLWRCLVQCQGVYPAEGTYWTACTVATEFGFRVVSKSLMLGSASWVKSGSGAYYYLFPETYKAVLSASLQGFEGLRTTDNVILGSNTAGTQIAVITNTNSFGSTSKIGITALVR